MPKERQSRFASWTSTGGGAAAHPDRTVRAATLPAQAGRGSDQAHPPDTPAPFQAYTKPSSPSWQLREDHITARGEAANTCTVQPQATRLTTSTPLW